MNNLFKTQIKDKLKNRIFTKSKNELIEMLSYTKENFYKYTIGIDNRYGEEKYINPLLWQMGHVIFFYSNHVLDNLINCNTFSHVPEFTTYCSNNKITYEDLVNFYDSFVTPVENRNGKMLLDFKTCVFLFEKIYDFLIKYIINNIKNEPSNIESYLISLGILHNEMHNEAFIFTKLNLYNIIQFDTNYNENEELINNIEFIHYSSGTFTQGINDSMDYLIFDNEMPPFQKKVDNFSISKYPITEYQFLQFVIDGGYQKNELWCYNSLKWIQNNNISMPLYWIKKNGKYFKFINGVTYDLTTNLPMMNISYYEAQAYCRWKGVRLPTETEFEYVSTNGGNTLYPWGDSKVCSEKCNINYRNFVVSVKKFQNGNNLRGVSQLIGNIWEWCQEPIYPYDGFKIDPVYREMSYPFFGFKRICKGGCFAAPDFLIHPRYRNAQQDDCRLQFIGFRVCL